MPYKPVQTLPRGQFGNNLWEAYSARLGRLVQCYSDLEYDHWVLVECNPRVETYCEQPRRIRVVLDGHPVESIFDMWIRWQDSTEEYREVKYAKDVESARSDLTLPAARQLRVQAQWCEQQHVRYQIITDDIVRRDRISLANWKRLLPYLTPTAQQDIAPIHEAVLATVKNHPIAWNAIIDTLRPRFEPDRIRASLASLLHQGRLDAPLDHIVIGPQLMVGKGAMDSATR